MPLLTDGPTLFASTWQRVRRECVAVVDEVGLKEVAFDLDVNKSLISNCLSERDHHHLRADVLVYLQLKSQHLRLCEIVPEIRGMGLVKAKPLSTEEKLARMERAIAQLGAPVQAFVQDQIYGVDGDATAPFRKSR